MQRFKKKNEDGVNVNPTDGVVYVKNANLKLPYIYFVRYPIRQYFKST